MKKLGKKSLKKLEIFSSFFEKLQIFSSFFEKIGNVYLLPNSITEKKEKKEIALKKLEKVFEKIGKKIFFLVKADNLPQKRPGFNPALLG